MDPDGRSPSYRNYLQPLFLFCTFHFASLNPSHSFVEPEENLEIMRSNSSSVTWMGKTEAQSKDTLLPRFRRETAAGDAWGSQLSTS